MKLLSIYEDRFENGKWFIPPIDADTRNDAQYTMSHDNWDQYWNAVIVALYPTHTLDNHNNTRMNLTPGIVYW